MRAFWITYADMREDGSCRCYPRPGDVPADVERQLDPKRADRLAWGEKK